MKVPTLEILYHHIKLASQRAWPHVVTCMIDKASTEMKDSAKYWHNQCNNLTTSLKSAEDKVSFERNAAARWKQI